GLSCFSPFNLPGNIDSALRETFNEISEIVEGLPWYQGDHSIFLQNGCPAIAVSSQWFIENMEQQELTHTPKDNLNIVNYQRVAECAIGIAEFIGKL
ncbi:MAG TPA: M28 family peptidase, partial [Paludibacteraceae bacterium]|nr:M28 family peptidase [Paludibacteraceae bacterium]